MLKIYTLPGCPMCEYIKVILSGKNRKFEACSDTDEMASLGIDHVPSAVIDGKIIYGKELKEYVERM